MDQFAYWANRSAEDAVSLALHMSGHIWDSRTAMSGWHRELQFRLQHPHQ